MPPKYIASSKKAARLAHAPSSISTQHSLFAYTPEIPSLSIGIDEAGRGCLAGPVVAAAVLLPSDFDGDCTPTALQGLTDSKKLTAAARESLAAAIRRHATAFGIGLVWQSDIDRINILQATFHAMAKAVVSLLKSYEHAPSQGIRLCIDGNRTIPVAVLSRYWHMPAMPVQEAFVGGDAYVASISAASILAKTHRDKVMGLLHKRWPKYNFAKHKGYGTREHLTALAQHGACPLHRLTFKGVCPQHTDVLNNLTSSPP